LEDLGHQASLRLIARSSGKHLTAVCDRYAEALDIIGQIGDSLGVLSQPHRVFRKPLPKHRVQCRPDRLMETTYFRSKTLRAPHGGCSSERIGGQSRMMVKD
jgi:hypothetical protein